MKEDLQTLSQLLVRLSTRDLKQIGDILKRRNLKVGFEIFKQ